MREKHSVGCREDILQPSLHKGRNLVMKTTNKPTLTMTKTQKDKTKILSFLLTQQDICLIHLFFLSTHAGFYPVLCDKKHFLANI